MKLKIKKIEKKQVWSENIEGEEMWIIDLIDPQIGLPKMKITSEERIEGFNKGDTIEIKLSNPQKTLK